MSVIIETSIGDITVDLYTDERPKCCMNFLKLCKIKYYNFSLFHTVQQNLVAQTGDPTASGRGGESIFVKLYGEHSRFFEMEVSPRIKHSKKGLISMVNNGSDMHGSQFFLTLADNLDYLDGKHTVFGELAEGFDIIDKLNNAYCDESNRPIKDIRIYHTIILHDPYDDPDGLIIPSVSPFPTEEMLNSEHIACDADIDEDKTEEELAEMMAEKEAKANTQILEMVGDLPDADVAPPDNVLFVCKLNPVTTAEDLEVIFSRFGPIVTCDVIKDSKTGESLQYAFIEFENPQHCENAYFKMDNVLIDDRRIHVDFSQSVSKFMWKRKGKVVEVIPTGDAPVYVLKNQDRSNDQYDLVYDHDDVRAHKEYKTGSKKRKNLADDAISQHRWKNSQSPVHNIISAHESRDGASLKGKRSRSSDTDGAVKNTRELEFQSKKSGSHTERHNVEKDIGRGRHVEHFQQIEVTKERIGRKRSRERNYDTLKKRPPQRSSNNEGIEDTKYCKTGHYPNTDSDNNQADKPSKGKKKKKKHHKHKKHSYSSD